MAGAPRPPARSKGASMSALITLYLMRHAEAEPGERDDSARGLTETGEHEAVVMSEFLQREAGAVPVIVTSGFARAIQTADLMGASQIVTTPWLDPDAEPGKAWIDIQRHAGDNDTALVITHHPLVNSLLELLTGAKTDDVHFHHAGIAKLDPQARLLNWLVTPKLVSRESELVEANAALAEAILDVLDSDPHWQVGESLKHPKHAALLSPIRADAEKLFRRLFRRQRIRLLKEIDGHLRWLEPLNLGEHNPNVREADTDAKSAVSSVIPDAAQIPLSLSPGLKVDYSKALTAALQAGYDMLAAEQDTDKDLSPDAINDYLRDHSLEKLTGDLNRTTVNELRDALADAYEEGGGYEEMVSAVKDKFSEFSDYRAGMIAQTEMNGAYNAGRKQLGMDLGFNEKSWNPDGAACPECMEAVAEGWIPIDEEFEVGVDAAPLHPNCDCGLDVRYNAAAVEARA